MKKIIVFTLCSVIALSFAACGSVSTAPEAVNPSEVGSTGMSNPWSDCQTLEEAQELAGFELSVPNPFDGYEKGAIRVIKGDVIEIIFENDENTIRLRKANGDQDISGDYNSDYESAAVTIDGLTVTVKGTDGKWNHASWTNGGFSYSITSQTGLDEKFMTDLIEVVNE